MESLEYIQNKWSLDFTQPSPIEIPNTGRYDLAKLFAELEYKSGAEIGVEKGIFSEVICSANRGVKHYAIDVWSPYEGYVDLKGNRDAEANYYQACKTLKEYGATIMREFSLDAVRHFPDNSLDYVYIDADHTFAGCVMDLFFWSKKVRPGGIISGHDFRANHFNRHACHVIESVTGFTQSYSIQPWFVLGTKEQQPGQLRERSRSFFWVKA